MKIRYTKEQIAAINDLCLEFRNFSHTIGEFQRLQEAKAALLSRNAYPAEKTLSRRLAAAIRQD